MPYSLATLCPRSETGKGSVNGYTLQKITDKQLQNIGVCGTNNPAKHGIIHEVAELTGSRCFRLRPAMHQGRFSKLLLTTNSS